MICEFILTPKLQNAHLVTGTRPWLVTTNKSRTPTSMILMPRRIAFKLQLIIT